MKRSLPAAAIAASLILSGLAYAQTPAAPVTRPAPTTTAPAATPPAAPGTATPAPTGAPAARPSASGSNVGFPTEAAAKAACPTDTIAWANPSSKVLHEAGDRYYGKTARGSYMCQTQAISAGYHVSGTKKK